MCTALSPTFRLALMGLALLAIASYVPGPAGASEDQTSPPTVKLDEELPSPGILKRIDGMFGAAVGVMKKVFFYEVGARDQKYIETNHLDYYVRDRGSSGPFELLGPQSKDEPTEITERDAKAYQAQGKVVLSALETDSAGETNRKRYMRRGKIGDREVDYVTITIDSGQRYIFDAEADVYRKELPKRKLISKDQDDAISSAEAKQWAAQGYLKLDDDKKHILSESTGGAPFVVVWLAAGAVFFTIYLRFVNVWGFRHALDVVRGKYDNPDDDGEVSHFQALSSALSATVGLGNIAGVTIAMTVGGPGAFFWMMACGFFGMTSKFVECTMGQKYRTVKGDGTVLGGPMQYLSEGLAKKGLAPLGTVLAIAFSIMCVLASFGGGNMFQANQAGSAVETMLIRSDIDQMELLNVDIKAAAKAKEFETLAKLQEEKTALQGEIDQFSSVFKPAFGVVLAILVAIVIIGGIKRIAAAAEKVVPTMCGVYVLACLAIIGMNLEQVPTLITSIFSEAFNPVAFGGGLLGVIVWGVQRAAFSNEAGVGSAAIAHSAAKTDEPVREGAVALLGPFIDTIVVCSMTALVILITNAWDNDAWVVDQGLKGAALASEAFRHELGNWFGVVFSIAVLLFAYSTIISWSYYGERSWERLFGLRSTVIYRALAVVCVFVGTIVNLGAVLDFSDFMILAMAFPNILGLLFLVPSVRQDLQEYWRRYRAGEFKTFK
jgi:AGCS family alanine or glycine:cation symporter